MKKYLVLCSGGLDSAVLAYYVSKHGNGIPVLLFVHYGQPAAYAEEHAVRALGLSLGASVQVRHLNRDHMNRLSPLTRDGNAHTKEDAFMPCRNLQLVTLGITVAVQLQADVVVLGNIAGGAYPDNDPGFARAFTSLLPYVSVNGLPSLVASPLDATDKAGVVQLGRTLGVPIENTWSCYTEQRRPEDNEWIHCGTCPSCQSRRKGFLELGIDDPTPYLT